MSSIAVLFSDAARAQAARRDLEVIERLDPHGVHVYTDPGVFHELAPAARTQFPEGIVLGATWCALLGALIGAIVAGAAGFAMAPAIGLGVTIGVAYGAITGGIIGAGAPRPEVSSAVHQLDRGAALVVAKVHSGAEARRTRTMLLEHAGAIAALPSVA